jgi:hypothetical protein
LQKLFPRTGWIVAERAFQIINDGQQFLNENFLLGRRTPLAFLSGALAEVIKVSGKP